MTKASRNQALMTAQRRGRSLISQGYHIAAGAAAYSFVVTRPAALRDVTGDTVSAYNVSLLPGSHTCDCAFFAAQGSHEKPCKHLTAVRLHVAAALSLLASCADMREVAERLEMER